MPFSLVAGQVTHLQKRHPDANLIVFVPKSQTGQALETAVARRTSGWHGMQATIPRHYAESIAMLDMLRSGRQENPVEASLFRAAQMLKERPDLEERHEDLPGRHHLAGTVADVIRMLREDGVSPEAVLRHAQEPDTADTLRIVATCYESYLEALDEHELYDDADIFRWARERVEGGGAFDVENTVYAVSNALQVSGEEARFLKALESAGRAFLRVGATSVDSPPDRCQYIFKDAPTVDVESPKTSAATSDSNARTSFTRAIGATNEVDAVLRDILQSDAPLGDATIAYVSSEPYATLIADRAEAAGIPVTTGTGLAASQSRSGRALRMLFEWVLEDYDPMLLVQMLREGLLRVDRWKKKENQDTVLYAHEAASVIAERSYEPGRDGLIKGLVSARAQMKNQDRTLRSAERIALDKLDAVTEYVTDLVKLVPREADARIFARRCGRFLETFGPDDPPSKDQEEVNRSLDEAARAVLWQRLDRLTRMPVTYEAPAGRLASLFQKWLDGQYVQAEHPRPGKVHILPLESAGYGDRSHLYVVGLDSEGLSAPPSENGLLRDEDREALAETYERPGKRSFSASDELLWDVQHALTRHRGPVSYYTRSFDLSGGEGCDPSAFFLAKEREANPDDNTPTRVVGLVPEDGAPSLFDRDGWLLAYRDGKENAGSPGGLSARQLATFAFPWLSDGAAARAARQSGEYTVHDGLLPEESYLELDLFGESVRAVSASRLQTLAETPYIYFLKYVLGVRPLDEPALEDEAWLNALRKGSLLHEVYERFVRDLGGRVPTEDDEQKLHEILDDVLDKEAETFAPSSPIVLEAARRELLKNATVFFRAEMLRDPAMQPEAFELGFGLPDKRRKEGDLEEAVLQIGEHTMNVSGQIDRVDRHEETGALSIWDYKTGTSKKYDGNKPVQGGKTLQWALYAYALEALRGETVAESGYYFANTKEVGARMGFSPADHRANVEDVISRLRNLTCTGTFPVSPKLDESTAWKYNGYKRIVSTLDKRKKEIGDKTYPDRSEPPAFSK